MVIKKKIFCPSQWRMFLHFPWASLNFFKLRRESALQRSTVDQFWVFSKNTRFLTLNLRIDTFLKKKPVGNFFQENKASYRKKLRFGIKNYLIPFWDLKRFKIRWRQVFILIWSRESILRQKIYKQPNF